MNYLSAATISTNSPWGICMRLERFYIPYVTWGCSYDRSSYHNDVTLTIYLNNNSNYALVELHVLSKHFNNISLVMG